MRVIRSQDSLKSALEAAKSEATLAFGNPSVFLEKYRFPELVCDTY